MTDDMSRSRIKASCSKDDCFAANLRSSAAFWYFAQLFVAADAGGGGKASEILTDAEDAKPASNFDW